MQRERHRSEPLRPGTEPDRGGGHDVGLCDRRIRVGIVRGSHAGMSGTRPVAAAQLAQPALEAAAEEYEAAQQPPAPAPAPEVVQVTLEQVRTVLARLSQAGHTAQVRELIKTAGANKLSEVDPSKFGQLLEQAEAIADA